MSPAPDPATGDDPAAPELSDVPDGRGHRVVAVVSGGMDSTTLAYLLADRGWAPHLLSVDYGQRHVRELESAERIAEALDCPHDVVDLRAAGGLLTGSALTDPTVAVPDGHYTDETMRSTVVPNRNAIFASVAIGVAVARSARAVALGVHAGDHAVYPDCRPAFITSLQDLARVANEGFVDPGFEVLAPFVTWSKTDIARAGHELGVPFAETWSCYRGGDHHCGTCGTCVERREAFEQAGVPDPTVYVPHEAPTGGRDVAAVTVSAEGQAGTGASGEGS